MQEQGLIFNVQHFSLNDGPGIRTVIFLKGCPLNCAWCHNPESKASAPQLFFYTQKCVGCRACVAVCPQGVHSIDENGTHMMARERCNCCGACATACSYAALEVVGKKWTVDEVLREIAKDDLFFGADGGVTISGGEPFYQSDFLFALLCALKKKGYSVCLETSGFAAPQDIRRCAPYVDCFLYDLKAVDADLHRRYVGAENAPILQNLMLLEDLGAKVVLRCPIIPGVNDRQCHFDALARLYTSLSHAVGIQIMPYHRMGQGKLTRFGANSREFPVPTAQDITQWNQMLSSAIAQARKDG